MEPSEDHRKTEPLTRKLRLSENTNVVFKIGTLVSIVTFTAWASVQMYSIKTNSEDALVGIRELRQELVRTQSKVDWLWIKLGPPLASRNLDPFSIP